MRRRFTRRDQRILPGGRSRLAARAGDTPAVHVQLCSLRKSKALTLAQLGALLRVFSDSGIRYERGIASLSNITVLRGLVKPWYQMAGVFGFSPADRPATDANPVVRDFGRCCRGGAL